MTYPLVATHCEIDMYADDSTVISPTKTIEEINGYLNTDIKEITKCCVENCISANTTKTKSMFITTWQKQLSLPDNHRKLHIVMNNDTLENVTCDKLLGFIIDDSLSGRNNHCDNHQRKTGSSQKDQIVCALS